MLVERGRGMRETKRKSEQLDGWQVVGEGRNIVEIIVKSQLPVYFNIYHLYI